MAGTSTLLRIGAIIIVAVVLSASGLAVLTFPRTVVELPVSFVKGFEREQRAFEIPWLHENAQVEVTVSNGTSLWRASITNGNGDEVWSHSALQGEQTTYTSGWIVLSSASYNLTFSIIGTGSLDAVVKLTSKGGIW